MERENRIQWVYNSQNNQELTQRYDRWAKDYERDLEELYGRPIKEPIVDLTLKYLKPNARILDVGAGTGIMGQQLHRLGYNNLTAIDLSQGMLAEAKKKNVYTALYRMVLGETLDFSTNYFDGAIACGVFTYGHAPSNSFNELIRITKPGGYIIFTLRPDFYENSDFKNKMSALETTNKWQLIERGDKYQAEPKAQSDLYLETWVYNNTK